MGFKSLNELNLDVVSSTSALDGIGMSACIIHFLDVINCEFSSTLVCKEVVCLLNSIGSSLIHLASDKGQELIVCHGAITVAIEFLEQGWHVLLADAYFEVFARFEEFSLGK